MILTYYIINFDADAGDYILEKVYKNGYRELIAQGNKENIQELYDKMTNKA